MSEDATLDEQERGRVASRPRLFARGLLHIVALSALAVAQPVFDLIGREPTFLVAHRATRWEVVVTAGIIVLAVPVVLGGIVWIIGLLGGARSRDLALTVMIGGLTALLALPVADRVVGAPLLVVGLVAALIGVVGAVAYHASTSVRRYATWLAPAILVVPLYFLFFTPVRGLVLPEAAAAAGPGTDGATTPVVVVVLDELPTSSLIGPDGQIDARRFPNLAGFAAEATWYRNATAVHPSTRGSVPSLLTGAHADEPLPVAESYPDNLFTLFEGSHALHVQETVTRLCPERVCPREVSAGRGARLVAILDDVAVIYLHAVLPDRLAVRLPPLEGRWTHFRRGQATADEDDEREHFWEEVGADHVGRFRHYVTELERGDEPGLHYVHTLLPHSPWERSPSGRMYDGGKAHGRHPEIRGAWAEDETLVTQALQRHLMQTRFTDRLVGELLDRLREVDLYDEAVIAITADHGIAFRPGDLDRDLSETNAIEVLAVPLIIRAPGQREGAVDDRDAELIDLLPTLADLAGVDVPWAIAGRSLVGTAPDATRPKRAQYRFGGWLDVPSGVTDEIIEIARRNHRRVGSYAGPLDLVAVGPHAEIVGRPVAELDVDEDARLTAEVEDLAAYGALREDARRWPTRVRGRIRGEAAEVHVAVAVNGTIAGVSRTFSEEGQANLVSAMTAEGLFRAGENELALYEVQQRGEHTSLRAITLRRAGG